MTQPPMITAEGRCVWCDRHLGHGAHATWCPCPAPGGQSMADAAAGHFGLTADDLDEGDE